MSSSRHPGQTTADERDGLVRELHHRVKNNLQIIVSLMNVQKRMLPPDRRGEIRFLEEHVQSMAAAYRVVYGSGELTKVSIDALIREVVAGIVEVSGGRNHHVETARCEAHMMINLDQAITLGLYLAVVLPPILDAAATAGGTVALETHAKPDHVCLAVIAPVAIDPLFDVLRERLLDGHLKQLGAERLLGVPPSELHIDLPTS
ncbi:histidine kinase dimerization/phosphoacceptor domain -containing protein [Acidisoma silvae]|uniref:histidine kinase n=1 Tax=Acidisoma silvae TaxID=2802396 RepID=A0A963YPM1_9PROT|nr:histidine kinase dimerization/phosphoacceptor domain -containing protein [Acidisoma silvae]MCB8874422.1 sensor histidine kinase [Acidisoma silvae]